MVFWNEARGARNCKLQIALWNKELNPNFSFNTMQTSGLMLMRSILHFFDPSNLQPGAAQTSSHSYKVTLGSWHAAHLLFQSWLSWRLFNWHTEPWCVQTASVEKNEIINDPWFQHRAPEVKHYTSLLYQKTPPPWLAFVLYLFCPGWVENCTSNWRHTSILLVWALEQCFFTVVKRQVFLSEVPTGHTSWLNMK